MKDLLKRIQAKKQALDKLRSLSQWILKKLEQDLSLEWTYNSNAIEGNTLTLRETRLVLQEGLTIKGKSLREHFEAKNHEKAIDYLSTLIQKTDVITENHILEIHRLALNNLEEDFAGRYRYGQVRIVGANFIPPAGRKVPDMMQNFIKNIQNKSQYDSDLSLATFIHHRFVWIHPFFDGNGRTARLLMNLFLMKQGYPPAVILRNDRKKYYTALNQANHGNFEKLELLIGQAMERSLDLYLAALDIAQRSKYEYQPLSVLAPNTPYSAEYLGLLARRGLIDAYKEGRNWVSTQQAIEDYGRSQQNRLKKGRSEGSRDSFGLALEKVEWKNTGN